MIHRLHTWKTSIQPRLPCSILSHHAQADLSCWEPLMPSASRCKSVDTLAEPHIPTPSTAARPTLSGVTFACSAGQALLVQKENEALRHAEQVVWLQRHQELVLAGRRLHPCKTAAHSLAALASMKMEYSRAAARLQCRQPGWTP